jgi:glycine dehydrogenase subunit 2
MTSNLGASGLIFNEPLLWEIGARGRMGFSMPLQDVPSATVEEDLVGDGPDFPDLCEPDIVRH